MLTHILGPRSTAIDIGCNWGSILREIVRLAPQGRHFAFEPNPRLARHLARRYPGVDVRAVALSDRAGSAPFHLFEDFDGFSGFMRHDGLDQADVRTVDIETARLDDIVPADLHVDLLKIDVEGAEAMVLAGARSTLARSRPVVVLECGKGGLDLFGTDPGVVHDFLGEGGLVVRPLAEWRTAAPVSRDAFRRMFEENTHYMWVATKEPGT